MQNIGTLDWSVSSEHYVIDSTNNQSDGIDNSSYATLDDSRYGLGYSDMFNYMVARKPIFVTFGLEATSSNYNENKADHPDSSTNGWKMDKTKKGYYGGYAYITSLTQNAPNGDIATYSIEMVGTGALKLIDSSNLMTYSAEPSNPVVVATPTSTKKSSNS